LPFILAPLPLRSTPFPYTTLFRSLQSRVDRLDRQADRAHQQRKTHHAAGKRGAGPAEREYDAEIGEERADEAAPSKTDQQQVAGDRKSTRLNSSHVEISYAGFCLK